MKKIISAIRNSPPKDCIQFGITGYNAPRAFLDVIRHHDGQHALVLSDESRLIKRAHLAQVKLRWYVAIGAPIRPSQRLPRIRSNLDCQSNLSLASSHSKTAVLRKRRGAKVQSIVVKFKN